MMEDRKLLAIPLVNKNNQVVGLETLQGLLKKPRHNTPVLLMAGGFGTRLRPLTNKCPKPLLRVGETPILEIMLKNFVKAGFVDFYISTHYLSHMVEDHFGDGSRWGVNINYLYEEKPLGTAGALSLLPKETSELPVIVMNGDILTNTDFESVLSFHLKNNASATMCVRDYEYQVPFGVVKSDGHKVLDIEEKPVQRFFVNTGIYVIGPELRAQVKLGQAIDMPTLLNVGMKMADSVMMYPVNEYWLDIGRPDDFEKAQVDVEQVSA
jgi:NDP-sugar pyrophosphorylase family protein